MRLLSARFGDSDLCCTEAQYSALRSLPKTTTYVVCQGFRVIIVT